MIVTQIFMADCQHLACLRGRSLLHLNLKMGVDSVTVGKIKPISLLSPKFEINMYTVTFEGIGEFACEDTPSLLSTFLDILAGPSSKKQTSLNARNSYSGGLLGSEIAGVNFFSIDFLALVHICANQ